MEKWELTFQGPVVFTCELSVRISDLNYGNHLGNDSVVSLLHESRMQFLRSFGYTELNIEGAGLILRDLSVVLKKEMFYADRLRIELSVPEWSGTGFRIHYRIIRLEDHQEVITALGHTTLVCYDYERKKTIRVPEKLLAHRFLPD